MDKKLFLLYGPPVSGKTTVADLCQKKIDIDYISIGILTRKEINESTKLGRKLKEFLDNVQEYDPELVKQLVQKHIERKNKINNILLLDGFPKYVREVRFFLDLLREINCVLKGIIIFDLPFEYIKKRVLRRKICSKCGLQQDAVIEEFNCKVCNGSLKVREDDDFYILQRRFGDYHVAMSQTLPELKKICENIIYINAKQSINKVCQDVCRFIIKSMPE